MDPKLSLAQTLRADLVQFPKRAAEVDRTWRQLLKLYPKVNFKKIKSQQQWDDFYSTIPEKVRRSFTEKPIDNPLLWLIGPISQDPAVQNILKQLAPVSKVPDQKHKAGEHKDDSIARHMPEPAQEGSPVASPTPTSTPVTEPKTDQAQYKTAIPIIPITQTRAPINKILESVQPQNITPQGITTPNQIRASAFSGEIIKPTTQSTLTGQIITKVSSANDAQTPSPLITRPTNPSYTEPIIPNLRGANQTNNASAPIVLAATPRLRSASTQGIPTSSEGEGSQLLSAQSPFENDPSERSLDNPRNESSKSRPSQKRKLGRRSPASFLSRIPGGTGTLAKVGLAMWPWGWVTITLTIILIVVVIKPDISDTNTYPPPTVAIETGDTKVQNPEGSVQGVATMSADGRSVLGLVDNLKELLDETADRLKEFYQKSLVTYTITGNYDGPAYEVKIVYPIPAKARFVGASGVYTEQKGIDETTKKPKTVSVTWLYSQNNGSSASAGVTRPEAPSGTTFTYDKYTEPPYSLPKPLGVSDVAYNQTTIDALNRLGNAITQNNRYLQSKFPAKFVDPFLSVIWVGAIEGIGDQPYFWNCRDVSRDINSGCAGGYYSGGWQVGYGIQVAQVGGHLAADFDSIYGAGSAINPAKVKEVGQAVITGSGGKIRNPIDFPSDTIPSLVSRANSGNQTAQQAIAVLLMDQRLGATAIALEVAADISSGNNWAQTMRGWGSYYGNNIQNFSNRAKAIADRYSGANGSNNGTTGTIFGSKSFTVTLLPIVKDDVLESGSATIIVDEVPGTSIGEPNASGSGTQTSTTASTGDHVPPSTNTCSTYSLTSNPAGKNYGDPTCNYDKNKLFDLLKKLDPANANLWFNKIIPCESAYNPNEFYRSGAAGDTPDPYGAWGLYQMGRGADGPFINLEKGSTNNPNRPEDRGDVNWELQTSNAVNFNKKYLIPNGLPLGAYWQCAR